MIADGGEAAVIDPRRDVDVYLDRARELGVRIRYVIDAHHQEDFVMGSAHLSERTGAQSVTGTHELILQQAGWSDVRNLLGGMSAWRELKLPLFRGDSSSREPASHPRR